MTAKYPQRTFSNVGFSKNISNRISSESSVQDEAFQSNLYKTNSINLRSEHQVENSYEKHQFTFYGPSSVSLYRAESG